MRIAVPFQKNFAIFLLSCIFVNGYALNTVTPPEKPKLVVLFVVEQMRYEYLERFNKHYVSGGFKKLMYDGTQCIDAHTNFAYGHSSSAFASIATGTTPARHGIIGNTWYNRNSHSQTHCVADATYFCVGGKQHEEYQVSAKKLIGSTFGEELMTQSFGRSRSFTISLDPQSAVLCSGHKSSGTFWLDEYSGNWVTSSYYNPVLPAWLSQFNAKGLATIYSNRTWNTFQPINKYNESAPDNAKYEIGLRNQTTFPYSLQKLKDRYKPYKILKTTPFGNTYVKDFAIELIERERLGKSDCTDFLTIAITATEEIGNKFGCLSKEIEDTYVRLDFELMFLLNYLETHIGKENFVFVLTSNHGMAVSSKSDTQKATNSGIFKPTESMYLLDKYLDITFGEDEWIEHYQNLQIYLNKKAIKRHSNTLAEVETACCDFLTKLTGIQNAVGSSLLSNHDFCTNEIFKLLDNSYNYERSGDILLTLKPNWEEQSVETVGSHISPYNYDTHVPLFWYGWKFDSKIITQPVEITDIIVNLCQITKISRPNMANGKIIDNLIK